MFNHPRQKLEIKQLDPIVLPPSLSLSRTTNRRVAPHHRSIRPTATYGLFNNVRKTGIASSITVVHPSIAVPTCSNGNRSSKPSSSMELGTHKRNGERDQDREREREQDHSEATGFYDSNGHFYRESIDFDAFASSEWYKLLVDGVTQRPRDRVPEFRGWITRNFPKLRKSWQYLRLLPDLRSVGLASSPTNRTSPVSVLASTPVPTAAPAAAPTAPGSSGTNEPTITPGSRAATILKTRMEQAEVIAWDFLYQNVLLVLASPGEVLVQQQDSNSGQVFFVLSGSCDLNYTPRFLESLSQHNNDAVHQLQHSVDHEPRSRRKRNKKKNINKKNKKPPLQEQVSQGRKQSPCAPGSLLLLAQGSGAFKTRRFSASKNDHPSRRLKSVPLKTLGSGDFFGLESVLFGFDFHLFSCISNGALCRNEIGLTTTNCMALFVLPIDQFQRARRLVVHRTASAWAAASAAAAASPPKLLTHQLSNSTIMTSPTHPGLQAHGAHTVECNQLFGEDLSSQEVDCSDDSAENSTNNLPKRRFVHLKTLSKTHVSFLKRTRKLIHQPDQVNEPDTNTTTTTTNNNNNNNNDQEEIPGNGAASPNSFRQLFPYFVDQQLVQFLQQTFVLRSLKKNQLEFLAASARLVRLDQSQEFLFTVGQPVEIFLIKTGQLKVFEEVQIATTGTGPLARESGGGIGARTVSSPQRQTIGSTTTNAIYNNRGGGSSITSGGGLLRSGRQLAASTNDPQTNETRKVELEILHPHDLVGLMEACSCQKTFKSFCCVSSSNFAAVSSGDNTSPIEAYAFSPFAWFSALAEDDSNICATIAETLQRHASWYKTRRSTALNHHNTHPELKLSLTTQSRGPLQCSRCGWPGHVSTSSQCIRANDTMTTCSQEQQEQQPQVYHRRHRLSLTLPRNDSSTSLQDEPIGCSSSEQFNDSLASNNAQAPCPHTTRSMSLVSSTAPAKDAADPGAPTTELPSPNLRSQRRERKGASVLFDKDQISMIAQRFSEATTMPASTSRETTSTLLPTLNMDLLRIDDSVSTKDSPLSPTACSPSGSSPLTRALTRLNSSLDMHGLHDTISPATSSHRASVMASPRVIRTSISDEIHSKTLRVVNRLSSTRSLLTAVAMNAVKPDVASNDPNVSLNRRDLGPASK